MAIERLNELLDTLEADWQQCSLALQLASRMMDEQESRRTRRDWEREPIDCPTCGRTEDVWVRDRDGGGLDFRCKACGAAGILDTDVADAAGAE